MWVYLKLLLTAFFWGGTFIAGRIVAQHVGPFSAAFVRFVIATTVLLTVVRKLEGRFPRISRNQCFSMMLLGLTGICLYNVFFFLGLRRIEAGRASLIIATNPVVIALGTVLFFKDRLSSVRCLGILISVSGALVVITDGRLMRIIEGGTGWGDFFILGCVLSWAAFSLIGKTVMAHISPLTAIAYASLAGTLGLMLPAIYEGLLIDAPSYKLTDWICLVYLGLFGTAFGFVWYYEGIKKLGPAAAGQFINFVPISAVLLAYLILQEPITSTLLLGLFCVSIGVYIVNSRALGFKHGTRASRNAGKR